ncbi:hypothetical protein ACFWNF_04575, partial [Streptomyces anulatus]
MASSSDQVAARWLDDPEQAVALVHELAAEGELAIGESLGATIDVVVVTGLPALSEACTTAATDPSTAAELCLPSYPTSRSRSPWPAPTSPPRLKSRPRRPTSSDTPSWPPPGHRSPPPRTTARTRTADRRAFQNSGMHGEAV